MEYVIKLFRGYYSTSESEDSDTEEEEDEEEENKEEAKADNITVKSHGKVMTIQREDEALVSADKAYKDLQKEERKKFNKENQGKSYLQINKPASTIHESINYQVLNQDMDESEDEDEIFTWMDEKAPTENNYICLCTKEKAHFMEGQQIYNCYGQRTNKFLLTKYVHKQLWVLY